MAGGHKANLLWGSEVAVGHKANLLWSSEMTSDHKANLLWGSEMTRGYKANLPWGSEVAGGHKANLLWGSEMMGGHRANLVWGSESGRVVTKQTYSEAVKWWVVTIVCKRLPRKFTRQLVSLAELTQHGCDWLAQLYCTERINVEAKEQLLLCINLNALWELVWSIHLNLREWSITPYGVGFTGMTLLKGVAFSMLAVWQRIAKDWRFN